jgi:hypothetical protein
MRQNSNIWTKNNEEYEPLLGFEFSKCSSDEMSSLPFLTCFEWKHIGGITFIGDIAKLQNFFAVLVASYWLTAYLIPIGQLF